MDKEKIAIKEPFTIYCSYNFTFKSCWEAVCKQPKQNDKVMCPVLDRNKTVCVYVCLMQSGKGAKLNEPQI